MRKFWSIVILSLCCSYAGYAQVILLQQEYDEQLEEVSGRVEIAILEWFFDKGLMALSEQSPQGSVNLELAQYMAQRMQAKVLLLWSIDGRGNFSLVIFDQSGTRLGELEARFVLSDGNMEAKVMRELNPLLSSVMTSLNLL